MEYLITFENGSSGYLAHYGVKGMKWGVWNEETKARQAGGKNKSTDYKLTKADKQHVNEAAMKNAGKAAVGAAGIAAAVTVGTGGATAISIPASAMASALSTAANTKIKNSSNIRKLGQMMVNMTLQDAGYEPKSNRANIDKAQKNLNSTTKKYKKAVDDYKANPSDLQAKKNHDKMAKKYLSDHDKLDREWDKGRKMDDKAGLIDKKYKRNLGKLSVYYGKDVKIDDRNQ